MTGLQKLPIIQNFKHKMLVKVYSMAHSKPPRQYGNKSTPFEITRIALEAQLKQLPLSSFDLPAVTFDPLHHMKINDRVTDESFLTGAQP